LRRLIIFVDTEKLKDKDEYLQQRYQLRVLLIHRGKSLFHDPESHLPKEEVIFAGAEYPFSWTQQEEKEEKEMKGTTLFGGLFG